MDPAGHVAYLDHAATTPMRPEAVDAMLPFLTERFGNASGAHSVARDARKALDEARDDIAGCLGCEPGELVLTSGGTEADNLAVAGAHAARPGAVVCSAVEHPAVAEACRVVGGRVVGVGADGIIDLDALAAALDAGVTLASVMLVNNEVGTIQPLAAAVEVVRERAPDAVVHTDAVQAVPWLDVATAARAADLVAVAAHKFGGPKGVGALVVRRGTPLEALLRGGGQERGRRSGTSNVAGAVAMAAALRATVRERAEVTARVTRLRDRLADGLLGRIDGCRETGDRSQKVPGNCHVTIDGIESEALLVLLDGAGVCASAGSSCASGAIEASPVLVAMGLDRTRALSSLRLSLGWTTTDADIDRALDAVSAAVTRLRA